MDNTKRSPGSVRWSRVAFYVFIGVCILSVTAVAPASAADELLLPDASDAGSGDSGSFEFEIPEDEYQADVTIDDGFDNIDVELDQQTISGDEGEVVTIGYTVEAGSDGGTFDVLVDGTAEQEVEVDPLEPEFGDISVSDEEAVFTTDDDTVTVSVDVDIENDGEGVMDVTDLSPDDSDMPDTIDPFTTETASIEVEVEASGPDEQTESGSVSESEGSTEFFDIVVDVLTPPIVDAQNSVDFGEVLVGDEVSEDVSIDEVAGNEDIEGLDTTTTQGSLDPATLTFDGADGFSTSGFGADDSVTATLDVEDDADQGEDISKSVSFAPENDDGISEAADTTIFDATVIYPAYFDDVSVDDAEIAFDEPRDEVNTFTETVAVEIANGGDETMELNDVEPTVDDTDVTASVADAPSTVGPGETETALVDVEADSSAPEGTVTVDVDVDAAEPTVDVDSVETDLETASGSVEIVHFADLDVEDPMFSLGDVILLEEVTQSTTLTEELQYEAIDDFAIEQTEGPEQWLSVTEQPSALDAGESSEFAFALEFDPDAELFRTYTWEFVVSGENIDDETVEITAAPQPIDFAETIADLEDQAATVDSEQEAVATELATALETLEEQLQDDDMDADVGDVTVLTAAAQGASLFLDAIDETDDAIDSDEREEAQRALVRASSAFNTLETYENELTGDEITEQMAASRMVAEGALDDRITDQQAYYDEALEEDSTTLEQAQTQRELARLSELAGDEETAAELEERSSDRFDEYSQQIETANELLLDARTNQEEIDDEHLHAAFDQQFFLITAYSAFGDESEDILDTYDEAIATFEQAGATERAAEAQQERDQLAASYERSEQLSLGIAAVLAVLFVGLLLWEARALYRYRQDAEETVSGDFLLPWAGTE